MKINEQIQIWMKGLRTNPSEEIIFSLIDAGTDAIPSLIAAWRHEKEPSIRNRFLEVLSELPTKATVPMFEQGLLSSDLDEVRFSVLGLFRFDALRFEYRILNAIQAHVALSKEKEFLDYIRNGFELAKQSRV